MFVEKPNFRIEVSESSFGEIPYYANKTLGMVFRQGNPLIQVILLAFTHLGGYRQPIEV